MDDQNGVLRSPPSFESHEVHESSSACEWDCFHSKTQVEKLREAEIKRKTMIKVECRVSIWWYETALISEDKDKVWPRAERETCCQMTS